jgi:hypothetical protein
MAARARAAGPGNWRSTHFPFEWEDVAFLIAPDPRWADFVADYIAGFVPEYVLDLPAGSGGRCRARWHGHLGPFLASGPRRILYLPYTASLKSLAASACMPGRTCW